MLTQAIPTIHTHPGEVRFFVEGIPAPGGSKKGFPVKRKNGKIGVAIVDMGGKRTKDWRKEVASAAKHAFANPFGGPVCFSFTFRIARPKCHFGAGRYADRLKESSPAHHVISPDATKLTRSTEDALKGIAWIDDCQVIAQTASKGYTLGRSGVLIRIWPVREQM